jgi:hypothetical protein
MEYLEGRALAGGAYDELKRYALIDRFSIWPRRLTDRGERFLKSSRVTAISRRASAPRAPGG